MPSIGPQLPPHLAKRKRTPSDDGSSDGASPPAKVRPTTTSKAVAGPSLPPRQRAGAAGPAAPNADEVALDDEDGSESDSDGGYGPRIPAATAPSKPAKAPPPQPTPRVLGPTLPPPSGNNDEIALDDEADDSDDDVGPALPQTKQQVTPAGPSPTRRAVIGPAPPPAPLSERPLHGPSAPSPTSSDSSDDDDDDDDTYGPSLPSSTSVSASLAASRRMAAAAAREAAEADASASGAVRRDDWMVAPPTRGGAYREADTTKIRARKFATGRPGRPGPHDGGSGGPAELDGLWTETAAEKRARLEDAVLGRGSGGGRGGGAGAAVQQVRGADDSRDAEIRARTEQSRGKSLYEEHKAGKSRKKEERERGGSRRGKAGEGDKEEEEDDPSKRAFDREKDMALGGKIGTAQRRELITRAADFGGRFAKGKYL